MRPNSKTGTLKDKHIINNRTTDVLTQNATVIRFNSEISWRLKK